jgi:hypothetical protein
MWDLRNEIEHDSSGDPRKEAKSKLIKKILWIVGHFSIESIHPYKDLTEQELIELPVTNLQMIEAMATLFRKWEKDRSKMAKVGEDEEEK